MQETYITFRPKGCRRNTETKRKAVQFIPILCCYSDVLHNDLQRYRKAGEMGDSVQPFNVLLGTHPPGFDYENDDLAQIGTELPMGKKNNLVKV
jgi:hypothetical protein